MPINTEIESLRQELKEHEVRLEVSLLGAEQVWWHWDMATGKLDTHYVDECILGFDHAKIDPTEEFWWSKTHPDDVEKIKSSLQSHFDSARRDPKAFWECEHRYMDTTGAYKWVLNAGRCVAFSEKGEPLTMIGVTRRIHDQKLQELALRDTNAELEETLWRLNHTFEMSPGVIFIRVGAGTEFTTTLVSPGVQELLGVSAEEFVHKNFYDFVFPDDVEDVKAKHRELDSRGEIITEYRILTEDTPVWIREHTRIVEGPTGEAKYAIGIFTDVSVERAQAEENEALKAQLVHGERIKSLGEMSASIAHEINNPLSVISLNAQNLTEIVETLSEESEINADTLDDLRDISETMLKHTTRISEIIKNMRAFARSDDTEPTDTVNLLNTVNETLNLCATQIRKHGIEIFVNIPVNLTVTTNSHSLQQVLMNFIHNAHESLLAFPVETPYIEIEAKASKKDITLSVRDNGKGMDKEQCERCLEAFYSTKADGTGLGLHISHALIKKMGAKLELDSIPGKRTHFTIRFPSVTHPDPPD